MSIELREISIYSSPEHLTLLVVEQWPDELGWGDLKGGVVAQVDKPGFPNIIYHQEDIPFVPLAEDDWELPSKVVPLFVDEKVGDDNNELQDANEIWFRIFRVLEP